jgi:hypothetical protein
MEAEKSTLLGTVTQQRLAKTNREDLLCSVVRSRARQLARAPQLLVVTMYNMSRDSSVGIATGCGLDGRGVGLRVSVGA